MRLTFGSLRVLALSGALLLTLSGCAADASRGVPPQATAVDQKAPGNAVATPVVSTTSPALTAGTVEQAAKATGARVRLPAYVPEGAKQEGQILYATGQGTGIATVGYLVGQRAFAVKFIVESDAAAASRKGEATTIGSVPGKIDAQTKEPSDPAPKTTTLTWREGGTTVMVTGDLAAEELLKVARSLL